MALSIAQMRASNETGLPETKVRICLSQKLVNQIQELETEKAQLKPEVDADGKATKPRRAADPATARIAELDELIADLLDKMREHTGELTLRAVSAGEWRRWADNNPPRVASFTEDGSPNVEPTDTNGAYGLVNATALLDSLGTYAVAWNGEPLSPADWEFISQNAAPGDLTQTCRRIVRLHEDVGMVPKSLTPSSSTRTDESV